MQTACSILYCHPWPVQLNYKFTHYLIKGTIFWKKKLFNIKCVFLFSPQIFLKYFSFYEKFSEILSSVSIRLHVKYPLFLPIPSIGIQIVAWGRTDRQIWRSSQSLSQFCKRAWKHVQHTRPPVIFTPPPPPHRQRSPRCYLNLTLCRFTLDSYLSCFKKILEIFCLGLKTRDTQNNTLFYEHTGPALKLKNIT